MSPPAIVLRNVTKAFGSTLAVDDVSLEVPSSSIYGFIGDMLSPRMPSWFVLFFLLTLLIYGAIFVAIGAACTDLRDAQTMMTPAVMLAVIPYMLVFPVVRSPDTTLSAVLSLIPFFTPFLMLVRVALEPGPPLWQLLLSFVLTLATTVGVVWAAGRIFRVGLLVQGKSATFRDMLRWVRS